MLWATIVLIAGVAAESRCHDQECLAASVAGDENSLLQKSHSDKGFSFSSCAEGFACGVLAGKVGEHFGGFKGFLALGGTQIGCGAVAKEANKFFSSEENKNLALEAHKVQPCLHKKLLGLVNACANHLQKQEIEKATAAGFGDALSPYKILAQKTKACLKSIAPDNKPNVTISAALYKACGHPGLGQKLAAGKSGGGGANGLCQLAGLTLVQLQNYLKVKTKVDTEIEEEEEHAEEDEHASEEDVEKEEKEIEDDDDPIDEGGDGEGDEGDGDEGGDDDGLLDDIEDIAGDIPE